MSSFLYLMTHSLLFCIVRVQQLEKSILKSGTRGTLTLAVQVETTLK